MCVCGYIQGEREKERKSDQIERESEEENGRKISGAGKQKNRTLLCSVINVFSEFLLRKKAGLKH